MAVFQEQDDAGYRFVVRPNCALSWRTTKYLIWFFAACFAAVGSYFASLGAWLVLPFAGLELVVVVAGFYLSAIAGHTREVIEIDGPVLRVLRGGRQLNEVASFPANWTRVVLQRDPTGWYPSRLLLRCHESRLEIAAKIVEAEREELARALEDRVGFAALGGGGGRPDDARTEWDGAPAHELHTRHGAGVFANHGLRAGAAPRVPPRNRAARSSGSKF